MTAKHTKPRNIPRGKPSRGRPPRHGGERLIKNRTFRVRGGLDEKLLAAAAASERSVSEEIEFRLIQSFNRDTMEAVGRAIIEFRGQFAGPLPPSSEVEPEYLNCLPN